MGEKGKETRKQGDKRTRSKRDKVTRGQRRQGDKE